MTESGANLETKINGVGQHGYQPTWVPKHLPLLDEDDDLLVLVLGAC